MLDAPQRDALPLGHEPARVPAEAEAELAEAYLALLNLGAALHSFLDERSPALDGRTRMFLARCRDFAGASAERAGTYLHTA